MKKCPNGHEVSDDVKFCPQCGAEIKESESSNNVCKTCGAEFEEGVKFCSKCGTPLGQSSKDSIVYDEEEYDESIFKKYLPHILGCIVVACIILGWYGVSNKGQTANEVASDSISETSTQAYSLEGLAKVTYKYDCCGDFHEGMAQVRMGDKIGYIDRMGNEVIPCIYDDIIPSRDDEILNGNDFYFHDGLALVCKDDKYFFINKKGEKAFPFKYDLARDFSEGLAVVYKDGKCGFIDTKGNEVIPLTDKFYAGFSEGLSVVLKDNKYGFIDKSGKIVIPMQFETDEYGHGAYPFMNGLAVIRKNGKQGYIDKNGKEVIPCIYESASNFSEGIALVRNDVDFAGYIDKKGNEVIPCIYERADDFSEGLALVSKEEIEFFINNKGEKVFSCPDYNGDGFHEGYASVGRGNNYGFIDKHGKEVVPRIYRQVSDFSEGLAAVCKDGIWGYVDTKGKSTFDVMSEEAKAQVKEKLRIEQEKREEEERRLEEENRARLNDLSWLQGHWVYKQGNYEGHFVIEGNRLSMYSTMNPSSLTYNYRVDGDELIAGEMTVKIDRYGHRIDYGSGNWMQKIE